MKCPLELARDMSALQAARAREHAKHVLLFEGRSGAGDESTTARKISWWQAAEILGIDDRHLRRIRDAYEKFGYFGLLDRRRGQPSPKRKLLVS